MMIIERQITPKILHWLDKNKILILKGSRQVGKTTLLKVIQKQLEGEGKKTFFFSIDQELDNPIFRSSRNLVQFLRDQHQGRIYLFLDEFQYLENPGMFLKTLFDQAGDDMQIIVSGSSSLEITKSSEFLTGRKIEFRLTPFTYREFVQYKTGLSFPTDLEVADFEKVSKWYELYRQKISQPLGEYFAFGGYPGVVTTPLAEDKIAVLKELVSTYIEKDVIAFLRIENAAAFRNLLKILCAQTGNLVNQSELSRVCGLSMDTLKKYLNIFEGTYVVDFARPHFRNVRKELSKMPKVYVHDFGLKNIVMNEGFTGAYISGGDRENFAYHALRELHGEENIKFYRTISKAEIDFIVKLSDGQLLPVEVKSVNKKMPEPKAIAFFRQEYKGLARKETIIITDSFLGREGSVFFIPLALVPFLGFQQAS